jgi:hypothetical protein
VFRFAFLFAAATAVGCHALHGHAVRPAPAAAAQTTGRATVAPQPTATAEPPPRTTATGEHGGTAEGWHDVPLAPGAKPIILNRPDFGGPKTAAPHPDAAEPGRPEKPGEHKAADTGPELPASVLAQKADVWKLMISGMI